MRDEMSERVAYYAALAAEGLHGHDATCPAYGVPSRQCMCGEDEREFLRRDVPALLAELEAARAVVEAARTWRGEHADACHVTVKHPSIPGSYVGAVRCVCGLGMLLPALDAYDAAKAGKAVE